MFVPAGFGKDHAYASSLKSLWPGRILLMQVQPACNELEFSSTPSGTCRMTEFGSSWDQLLMQNSMQLMCIQCHRKNTTRNTTWIGEARVCPGGSSRQQFLNHRPCNWVLLQALWSFRPSTVQVCMKYACEETGQNRFTSTQQKLVYIAHFLFFWS